MERLLVLDTETTGIEVADGHRVIEIGIVEIEGRNLSGNEYHQYLNPERSVGESQNVHSLSDKFLADKPKFSEVFTDFLKFIEGGTLIIHNAPFDLGFLNNELKRAGTAQTVEKICPIIDSLELSRKQRPGAQHSLDALCRRFSIDASARTVHGALLDAKILAQVYLRMTGGQSVLFSENRTNGQAENDDDAPVPNVKNSAKNLKIIRANPAELRADKNYFKQSG